MYLDKFQMESNISLLEIGRLTSDTKIGIGYVTKNEERYRIYKFEISDQKLTKNQFSSSTAFTKVT